MFWCTLLEIIAENFLCQNYENTVEQQIFASGNFHEFRKNREVLLHANAYGPMGRSIIFHRGVRTKNGMAQFREIVISQNFPVLQYYFINPEVGVIGAINLEVIILFKLTLSEVVS